MVPLTQITSKLLSTLSRQTIDKRIKLLGDALVRRKASLEETQLLKDSGVIPRKAITPWLVPRSKLDDIFPFLISGDPSLLKNRQDGQDWGPDSGLADDMKKRLARALCRLESDFHDSSPLSVKSISSATGVRASSMRAGFSVGLHSAAPDDRSLTEHMNGGYPMDFQEYSTDFEDYSYSDSPNERKVESPAAREEKGNARNSIRQSVSKNEPIIAISNDCDSTPIHHLLFDYDYDYDYDSDLVVTGDDMLNPCSKESDDPDFTLYKNDKVRVAKEKRRHRPRGRVSKRTSLPSVKKPNLCLKAVTVSEDHAAMKREYDAHIQQSEKPGKPEMKKSVNLMLPKTKLEVDKKRQRQRAKQLLDKAHKAKAISKEKQPVAPVQVQSPQAPAVVRTSKPLDTRSVKKMRKFQSVVTPRHPFCIQDAILGHPLLMVKEDGELEVRRSGCLDTPKSANELPHLCHPIWDWRIGQSLNDSNKRTIVRRVKLTTVPPPSQHPTKSRSKRKQSVRQGTKKWTYPPFGIR
jgi:hypothetical protein